MRLFFLVVASVLLLSGCAYKVDPISMPALQVYSSYDQKVPGTWVVVIDDSVKNVVREIKASSYVCSAHTYPINMGETISTSIKRTLESVFENVIERTAMPTSEELKHSDYMGTLLVKLDTFEPRVQCTMGFWSASCTASTDIEFGVIVRGQNGKLFSSSVGDSALADGDSGGACGGVPDVLSQSISKSIREALERMGERIANSPRLRKELG